MKRTVDRPRRWRQAVRRLLSMTLPPRRYLVAGPPDSRSICLTFDDGPHPEHTPALLDALAERQVRATFFLVGARAREHAGLVRRIAAEAHDVGHHSYSHGDPETTSAARLAREVEDTATLLADLIGRRPTLFRPPHGKITVGKALALWRGGQTIVLWNVDPKDFTLEESRALVEWASSRHWAGGDLVLLHDTYPHAAVAVPTLVDAVRGAGLRFGVVSEWLGS